MNALNYIRTEKVGEGTYGVVYKAKQVGTNKIVAMKKVRLDSEDEGVPATAIREISLLKEICHPNIVSLIETIYEETKLFLVFEFMDLDLRKYLDVVNKNKKLTQQQIQSFMFQILSGIDYCHARRILHRDLKPQNLLVDKNGVLKIADLGLGRTIGLPSRNYTHEVVTLWYRAPEILLGNPIYSTGIDMWSIACIFGEMTNGKAMFPADSEIDELFRIFRTLGTPNEQNWPKVTRLPDYKATFPHWDPKPIQEICPSLNSDGQDLLEKMFRYNPSDRISAKSALIHPYFLNYDGPIHEKNWESIINTHNDNVSKKRGH